MPPPRGTRLPTLLVTHGRDQRWQIELDLADQWAKALRSGLKRAEAAYWESIPVRFAFYGDVWRDDAERSDDDEVTPAQAAFARDLLGKSDERFPWDSVADLIREIDKRFKVGKVLLRYFMADLDAYFEDPRKRKAANDRLVREAKAVDGDLLLLGHSMGSIVSYLTLLEAPAALRKTRGFLTFGSPMGMPSLHQVIARHAAGTPFPLQPARWMNIYNKEDFATVERHLAELYPARDRRVVEDAEAKGRPPTALDVGRGHDPLIYLSSMGLARALRSLIETAPDAAEVGARPSTGRVAERRDVRRVDRDRGDEPEELAAERQRPSTRHPTRAMPPPPPPPPMDVSDGTGPEDERGGGGFGEGFGGGFGGGDMGAGPEEDVAPARRSSAGRGRVAGNGGGSRKTSVRSVKKNGGRRGAPRPKAPRPVAKNGGRRATPRPRRPVAKNGGRRTAARPSRAAARRAGAPSEMRRVTRTASADFPPVVAPDSERELLFAIGTRAVFARSTTFSTDVPSTVRTLELRVGVHAPDFTTRTESGEEQSWEDITLDLDNPDEQQDLRFRLRARATAKAVDSTIVVTVYKASLPLGSIELATRIDPKYRAPAGSFALSFAAAPEPDFTLIISDRSRDVVGKGPFELRIGREQEYVDKPLGEFRVTGNAWAEARKILERYRSIKKLQDKADRIEAAQAIGVSLWWRLTDSFHKTYWEEMHGRDDLSIAIYSQEPYIPWELIVPQRRQGSARGERMLGVAFSMARWSSGREFPDPLRVSGFSVIAPEYDVDELPMAQQEADDLVAFGARKVPGRRSEVRRLLRSKGVQLIHFAGHGSYNPDKIDDSSIRLSDGMLVPNDLAFASIGKAEHPFVMLNACQVGEKGWDLTQIGGWAEQFCSVGFSGFVGPYWRVSDGVARKAAGLFYTELRDRKTVGQAMQTLRAQFREDKEFPAHPSWLAYTLHCQPNVHVEMPGNGGGPG